MFGYDNQNTARQNKLGELYRTFGDRSPVPQHLFYNTTLASEQTIDAILDYEHFDRQMPIEIFHPTNGKPLAIYLANPASNSEFVVGSCLPDPKDFTKQIITRVPVNYNRISGDFVRTDEGIFVRFIDGLRGRGIVSPVPEAELLVHTAADKKARFGRQIFDILPKQVHKK
ncbi:hypothetical protein GOV07_03695 [Candidatus Woesearchaeota archaeon]|nr:hypothetical protein [Candidatus Woesearchaeota archaeon]